MQYVAKTDMLRGPGRPAPFQAEPRAERCGKKMEALADPQFELIVGDPAASFRWHRHDYPSALARWNYHPEYEIHLIAESAGKMFVGDHIGAFGPGNLLLVGPDLPHHWVSDLEPGERVEGRRRRAPVLRGLHRGCAPGLSRVRRARSAARGVRGAGSSSSATTPARAAGC